MQLSARACKTGQRAANRARMAVGTVFGVSADFELQNNLI